MDLNNFQRKAILLVFISILAGSLLLARREPLPTLIKQQSVSGPRTPAPKTSSRPKTASLQQGKLDINLAGISELTKLPGIGPSLANQIIVYRTQNGPFISTDDLVKVSGIGPAKLARIKNHITLPAAEAATGTAKTRMELNTVTNAQLQTIPGIGPKTAQAIIDYRTTTGRYNNFNELLSVPRIGPKTLQKLKLYLYVTPVIGQSEHSPSKLTIRPKTSNQIDLSATCPHCGRQLWEPGQRKQVYIRCPHCLKLINSDNSH